ncbi:hypothetical protein LMG24238_00746 [Paraburkholderia sediminicola]|uniref:Uncharacterized protein n=1 Tax=Paraburkholderia sediminicola TaxID=458836 RepID=A0A6J4ZX74_9BURK|nr:glycosyltransferase family 4 protein [Paraburkholderia sediminicola]CAB3646128.1 hypothetical protein LMG24238_00746 [Paraburkholderia sediminicola]
MISKNLKLSALYLASRPPYPAKGGRERLIAQSIEFLAPEYDLHVVVFCRSDEKPDVDSILALGCKSVKLVQLPGALEVLANVLIRRLHSLQENLFFSRRTRTVVRKLVSSGISVVIADMLRTGQYCEDMDVPKVLDLDDLLSERYRQFLVNGCKQTVFGTFSKRIPKSLLMAEPLLRRLVLERERRMMARRELSTPHRFDVTFLTSETEASQLRGDGANVRVYANPQATAASTYDWRMIGHAEKLVQCFFIGNLRTSQNLASLKLIVREIMPLVLERGLDIHVHVVGDYDDRAIETVSGCSRVTMHGFISDLSEVVQRCSIALLPIVEGTGVKTKILDAMAMGIPVVTNGLGVEGLSVVHERDLLIADTAREIADQIARLNLDDGLGKRLSEQAKSYVARNHDPTLLRERFREHIFTALEVGRARLMYSSPGTVS